MAVDVLKYGAHLLATLCTSISSPLLTGLSSKDPEYNIDPSYASYAYDGFINPSITTTDQVINLLETDKDPFADYQWTINTMTNGLTAPVDHNDMDVSHTSSEASLDSDDFNLDGWLLWNPGPPESTPPLVRHSMETLLRVIKTWPKMLAKEFQVPPMLHYSHTQHNTMLQPMANCVTISKMWACQSEGATEIVRQTIIQGMRSLFERVSAHILLSAKLLTHIVPIYGRATPSISHASLDSVHGNAHVSRPRSNFSLTCRPSHILGPA